MTRVTRIALLLAAAAPPLLYAQEQSSPLWGGIGGTTSYTLDCSGAGVLIGVSGKVGLWVDQIEVICQRVNSDGSLGRTWTYGPTGGTGGTSQQPARCSSGRAVGKIAVRSGMYIERIQITCWPWKSVTRSLDFTTGPESKSLGDWSGGQGYQCSQGKVGKGFRGKHGSYIDSMQFICDDWNR